MRISNAQLRRFAALPRRLPIYGPSMPADVLFCVPGSADFDALELGVLLTISTAYWRSGARSTTYSDTHLLTLSRCHLRQWHKVRARVVPVFTALCPIMTDVYNRLTQMHQNRSDSAKIAAAASVKRRLRKPKLSDDIPDLAPLVARKQNTGDNKNTVRGHVASLIDAAE